MPLVTEVIRDGKRRTDFVWTDEVLNCFLTVAMKETDPTQPIRGSGTIGDVPDDRYVDFSFVLVYYLDTKCPLWTKGSYTLKKTYKFKLAENETFELRAGDELRLWREHK